MSVRDRVVLLIAVVVGGICACLVGFVVWVGDLVTETEAERLLVSVVEGVVGEVDWDDGEVEVDDDVLFYSDGVYVLIYYGDGTFFDGYSPDMKVREIPLSGGFADGEFLVREVRLDDGERVLVCDAEVTFKKHDSIWVRGVISLSGMDSAISAVARTAVIALPVIVVLAAGAGYFITKSAFAPVKRIVETVERISGSGNLGDRIGLRSRNKRDEIVHLAAEFDLMLDKVEKSFEAEKQFTSDASHELRTPVSVIRSQAEYALDLIEKCGADEIDEIENSLSVILKKSERMASLVSQLLTLARADRGTEKLVAENVDVSALFRGAAEEFSYSPAALERNIDVAFSGDNAVTVKGDRGMLSRMAENLISNAVKFNRDGGKVAVSVRKEGDSAVFEVSDTGVGISQSDIEKIFDRFYQADKSRSSGDDGSMGLGLAMVKWIAETAHGGKVSAVSRENEGSTFTVTLPSV